jgi:hypothetical protein
MLYYDQRSRRFVGSHYLVSTEAFFDRVQSLCRAGENIPDALNYLQDERTWSLADAGVAPLYTAESVITEAEAMLAAVR